MFSDNEVHLKKKIAGYVSLGCDEPLHSSGALYERFGSSAYPEYQKTSPDVKYHLCNNVTFNFMNFLKSKTVTLNREQGSATLSCIFRDVYINNNDICDDDYICFFRTQEPEKMKSNGVDFTAKDYIDADFTRFTESNDNGRLIRFSLLGNKKITTDYYQHRHFIITKNGLIIIFRMAEKYHYIDSNDEKILMHLPLSTGYPCDPYLSYSSQVLKIDALSDEQVAMLQGLDKSMYKEINEFRTFIKTYFKIDVPT